MILFLYFQELETFFFQFKKMEPNNQKNDDVQPLLECRLKREYISTNVLEPFELLKLQSGNLFNKATQDQLRLDT